MSHKHYAGDTVDCPSCEAPAGQRCRGTFAPRGSRTHSARRRAAQELLARQHIPTPAPHPRTVTCQTCGASPGQGCPPEDHLFHPERIAAAQREYELQAAIRRDQIGFVA